MFRELVLYHLNPSVIVITETHCCKDEIISIEGYKVVQYNRKNVSQFSTKGSGGLAIAFQNLFLKSYNVLKVYHSSHDGILAIKLYNKFFDVNIAIVGNYLPPDSFHYGRDPETSFNANSVIWTDLSDCDLLVGAGDLNSRTKNYLDFLPDVDGYLLPRSNPDNIKNSHGELFLQFLRDNRALICNGRITSELNNFTFISPQGKSVPDYIYCPADHINFCKSVKVWTLSDIINQYNIIPPRCIPDHSVILGQFDVSCDLQFPEYIDQNCTNYPNVNPKIAPKIKNFKKINDSFMASEEQSLQIKSTISCIENMAVTQKSLNEIYLEIKNIFLTEISKLPNRPLSNDKKCNRKFRQAQEFWNEELYMLWQSRCKMEKQYLNFTAISHLEKRQKQFLLLQFKVAQKHFDKKFRFFKRKHESLSTQGLSDFYKTPQELWKRLKLLSEPKSTKVLLEIIREDGSISTDVKEILFRWHSDFSKCFQGVQDNPDIVFDDEFYSHICELKSEFEQLSSVLQCESSPYDSSMLNCNITFEEVSSAIDKAKARKSYLDIPNEALKNPQAKQLLFHFFSICFKNGLSPFDWDCSDIIPVPKSNKDPRVPLFTRPISIQDCVAKCYSDVLNVRLQKYLNDNNILVDEQNGFRAGRSCLDHVFSLVTILRNRQAQNKSTFLNFVDFKNAFTAVDRNVLMYKLSQIGIVGNMYNALSSMYRDPKSRIILQGIPTDYFSCTVGLKQGAKESPTIFSVFINDLALELKDAGVGVHINFKSDVFNNENVSNSDSDFIICTLLYADDIICLAETEEDLQTLIDIIHKWCQKNRLEPNMLKTNILHVRCKGIPITKFVFKLGNCNVSFCSSYKYLGVLINEFLNLEKIADARADAASRALGSIITKMIKNKGFPMKVYRNLYETCVLSVLLYGAEVSWGFKQYNSTLKLHHRALRAFLGVSSQTPICGIKCELQFMDPQSHSQLRMIRQWMRMRSLPDHLLTRRILNWDINFQNSNPNLSTWSNECKTILSKNGLEHYFYINCNTKDLINSLKISLFKNDMKTFQLQCMNMPILRTYIQINDFEADKQNLYEDLNFKVKKRFASFRLGTLPIRIHSGRFERPRLNEALRICQQCLFNEVECTVHFSLRCPKHVQLRTEYFCKIGHLSPDSCDDMDKLKILCNSHLYVKQTALFISSCYDNRYS